MDAQANAQHIEPVIYQGQFGEFTITESDRHGVIIYRVGLLVAAVSFALGVGLLLWQGSVDWVLGSLTLLYGCFSIALGVSLATIHIYLLPLHRTLQIFWGVGTLAAIALSAINPQPLALVVYEHPALILATGFTFAALTGIFFKEAFCFNRLETKVLTPVVPLLLLGHLLGVLSVGVEQTLLALWAVCFMVFALRKAFQPIPPDIGDKSVFAYLKQQSVESVSH